MKLLRSLIALTLFSIVAVAAVSPTFAQTPEIAAPGSTVTLVASASGVPAPTFEWFKNGTKLADGATLVLPSVTSNDSASYTVRATNIAGSAVSDPLVLAVASPPSKPTIKVTSTKPSGTTVSVTTGTRVVTTPK